MTYGSLVLSTMNQAFCLCEYEILVLIGALNHWNYFTGMSHMILRTVYTPTKLILTGRIKNTGVSSPLLAKWRISLLSKNRQPNQ